MKSFTRFRLWMLFVLVSIGIFFAYYFVDTHQHETFELYSKGLSALQHMSIHYVTGLFFALLILHAALYFFQKRLNEPIVFTIAVLWSHFPDFRFSLRQLPHDPWEIIFFFHTVVDEYFFLSGILLNLIFFLGLWYIKRSYLLKKPKLLSDG